jgi:predicted ATPase with chaperone activity
MLRQPIEESSIMLARSNMTLSFPADFILIGAMNPCPCGFFSDSTRECRCTGAIIQRYLSKISGPLLDRIDLHVEVPIVPYKELRGKDHGVKLSRDAPARGSGPGHPTAARILQRAHSVATTAKTVCIGRRG